MRIDIRRLAVALLMAASASWAADLEVGDPRSPVPAGGQQPFPPIYPLYGRMLRFESTVESVQAVRDKVAKHADRPVLIVLSPDAVAQPQANFRMNWLANLLMSPSDEVQQMLAQTEVTVATLGTVRGLLQDARADVAAYLVATRNGRPFAFALDATDLSDEAFIRQFRGALLTGPDAIARAEKCRDGLAADIRRQAEDALKRMEDDSYLKREAASRAMAKLMPGVSPWLQSMIAGTKDAEVRARLSTLLAEAGQGWQTKPPVGVTWTGGRTGVGMKVLR